MSVIRGFLICMGLASVAACTLVLAAGYVRETEKRRRRADLEAHADDVLALCEDLAVFDLALWELEMAEGDA